MALKKIDSSPDWLKLRRGTQGQTVREIEAIRVRDRVMLSIKSLGGQDVSANLDRDETAALRDWLMLVPDSGLQSGE